MEDIMTEVPQMATVAELRHNHLELFGKLAQGPVVIAQRSKPAAVLVSVEAWNRHVQQMRDLQLLLLHHKRWTALQQDPSQLVTEEELEQQLTMKVAA
jgi:PHD/YefM family antitoxin component YafN of YafNO toxin-antitoxin module